MFLKGRSKSSKSLVVYSDIHVGARTSVCTNDPEEPSYRPNKFQKMLYELWNESIDELTQKPTVKVINGEPFNGSNQKDNGRGNWTTNMALQEVIQTVFHFQTIFWNGKEIPLLESGLFIEKARQMMRFLICYMVNHGFIHRVLELVHT